MLLFDLPIIATNLAKIDEILEENNHIYCAPSLNNVLVPSTPKRVDGLEANGGGVGIDTKEKREGQRGNGHDLFLLRCKKKKKKKKEKKMRNSLHPDSSVLLN